MEENTDQSGVYRVKTFVTAGIFPTSAQELDSFVEQGMKDGFTPYQFNWSPNGQCVIVILVNASAQAQALANQIAGLTIGQNFGSNGYGIS